MTKKDALPLPRVEDIIDTFAGSKFFTTLDLAMGYLQVELHFDDREKTAFSTPFGLFQYAVWTRDNTRYLHALDDNRLQRNALQYLPRVFGRHYHIRANVQ